MGFTLLSTVAEAATADAAATTGTGLFGNVGLLVVMIVMIGFIYFFMMRPQKKKEKEAAERRNSIEVGDEIVTIGGIVGRVVSLKEDTFVLETAGERSRLRFKRWAIQDVAKLEIGGSDEGEAVKANKSDKAEKATKADKASK